MTGRRPCICKVPPAWVLNQYRRSTKAGELQLRSRRNRRRPFDRPPAQGRHMSRARTFGRQRRRQQSYGAARPFFFVGMRARIKSYLGGVTIVAAWRSPLLLCEDFMVVAATGATDVRFTAAHDRHTAARERDESHPARRQQVDRQQQLCYVSLRIHRFRVP